jgi:hypothetical protein
MVRKAGNILGLMDTLMANPTPNPNKAMPSAKSNNQRFKPSPGLNNTLIREFHMERLRQFNKKPAIS